DTTSKQQEDLPYDGDLSQTKRYSNYSLTSKNDALGVSNQMILTVKDLQEEATHKEICSNAHMDKRTENGTDPKPDKEKQYTANLHIPANKGDPSKSNISAILLHHFSKEEFLKGKGIHGETFSEVSDADSFDTIIKNIILQYVKNSWPKERAPELTDQLTPQKDKDSTNTPCWQPTMMEENACKLEEPMATGDSSHQENPNFLTKIKRLSDKQKCCQEQAPQKQHTKKANLGSGFKYSQGQVHYQFSSFSKVVPKMNFPKNNIIDRPLLLDKRTSSFPKLRDKSAIVQDMLEALSRSSFVEKQEQKRKTTELLQQTQVISVQRDPSLSSSYIFQKLSQGNHMCQMLKEQTDQLKSKVQEFAKSIAQESPYHLQDRRLVLEKLQGHLEFLEQEFLATKEKHLTSRQQVYQHDSPAPERKAEGEIFKLEMLLGDVKEKIKRGKYTSALSLPMNSPTVPDDLASSPPSNEVMQQPTTQFPGPQQCLLKAALCRDNQPCCAFCHQVLVWQQRMEEKGNRGRSPTAIQERALHPDSILTSEMGCRGRSAPSPAVYSNTCEGQKLPRPGSICNREPSHERGDSCCSLAMSCDFDLFLLEFFYRYNTPEQNYLNHSERCAFVQLYFLKENKNSSLSYSKPKCICSQRASSKSSQDGYKPIPGKKSLKAFMTYSSDFPASSSDFHSGRISGGKSSCNVSSTEEMESEILNTSLDHALRTATTLKETTDQMIKTIAEDLA
ncbi:Protein AKNAD1, partial [Galemys pyrenaicus]